MDQITINRSSAIPLRKNRDFSLSKDENHKLDELTQKATGSIYELSSVFPFDFFPNTIYIEQKQLVFIYRQFFWSTQEFHVLFEDILSPIVESGVFFSTLRLQLGPGGFKQDPPPIRYLKKEEALRAKRIIVGLLICNKEKIDFADMTNDEILVKVEKIGSV